MGTVGTSRIGTHFGKYEIIGLLGRGGMGEVYEARDTQKGRLVALKILVDELSNDPEYRSRFTREAHGAAQLQEPHVIPIHDWGEIDGSLYIDMRLVRGTDLRKMLSSGSLPPARAVNIVGQIAGALDAAHADGLIHRDVKPENIIVTEGDFACLLDFGIAEKSGDTRLTQAGMTVGSLAYMAPERLEDQQTTAVTDVYSLACVLHEALTGDSPFATESMQRLITAHLSKPPPRPSVVNPRVPASFDAVIERGMAKEPDDRYGTAGAFARAAARALAASPQPTPSTDPYATQAAQHASAPTAMRTRVTPTSSEPEPVVSKPIPTAAPRKWLMPAAIAVCAALFLAAGGIAIGIMMGQGSGKQPAPEAQQTLTRLPVPDRPAGMPPGPDGTYAPTRPAAQPPIVRGADANMQSCDNGVAHPTGNGHSARGTQETTCLFAQNVLNAYLEAAPPSSAPRTVYALGSVPCSTTGGNCLGNRFVMQCATFGTDDWVTCTGGKNARVYIY